MTIKPARLWGPTVLSTVATSLYTAPANTTAIVNRAVFTNVAANNLTITVWIVRSGNVPGEGNIVTGAAAAGQLLVAGPSTPYIANELAGLVLNAGDAIWAACNDPGSVNSVGSGWTQ